MLKQVKVMRGISGAGKSTLAKKLQLEAMENGVRSIIVSADDFFVDDKGEYKFDVTKLGEAHKFCLKRFLSEVRNNTDLIIVDNTNINLEDMAPYVALGEAFDYDVEIVQVDTPAAVGATRNVHNVPPHTVRGMDARLAAVKVPSRYKVRRVAGTY